MTKDASMARRQDTPERRAKAIMKTAAALGLPVKQVRSTADGEVILLIGDETCPTKENLDKETTALERMIAKDKAITGR